MSDASFAENRPHLIPCIIAILMLLGALGEWPYGYYTLLRFVVSIAAVIVAVVSCDLEKTHATYIFGLVAVLFNPLIPIHLTREIWQPINVIAAGVMVYGIFIKSKGKESDG